MLTVTALDLKGNRLPGSELSMPLASPLVLSVSATGGELVFLVNGTLLMLTTPDVEPVVPAGSELLRPYFGMRRFEWVGDPSIDFHLGYGDWIRVLASHGFQVERLAELGTGAAVARDPALRSGVNIANGQVTHTGVAEAFGMSSVDPAAVLAATR